MRYCKEHLDIRGEVLKEHRCLLAGLIERVSELEASVEPTAPSQSREEPGQEPEGARAICTRVGSDGAEAQNGSQRPWWRRLFG